MPGTILLEDFQKANSDELRNHLTSLLQAPASAPPVSSDSLTNPIGTGNLAQPTQTRDELQAHLDSLMAQNAPAAAPEATAPAPQPLQLIGEGLTSLGAGAQNVRQELSDHLTSLLAPPQTTPAAEPAPGAAPAAPTPGGPLQDYARQAATRAGIDPDIFVRQIQQESGFNPGAKSPAGAQGIAQFMPQTAAGMGVDVTDPYSSLDGAARLMADNLRKYGGDYSKALAAYNAGGGNVDRYGGVPPFEETQRYVSTILGGVPSDGSGRGMAGPALAGRGSASPGTARGGEARLGATESVAPSDISQFGSQLTADEAVAACGPAAAVRFAQRFGRNPTLREATDLAATVGWTKDQGMAGLGSEKALMDKMGVATKLIDGADWGTFANEAKTGNPVIVSTAQHYYSIDGWDPTTGKFHVGRSGLDLRGGSEWMSQADIERVSGRAQGALLANNPLVPQSSTVQTGTMQDASARRGKASLGPAGSGEAWRGTAGGLTAPFADQQMAQTEAPKPLQIVGEGVTGLAGGGGLKVIDNAIDSAVQAPQRVQPGTAGGPPDYTNYGQAAALTAAPQTNPTDRLKTAFGDFVDSLGSSQLGQNVTGTNPDQEEINRRFAEAQQATEQATGARVELPTDPLSMLGGASLGAPTSGEQATEERNRAIEQANPIRDVPVAGGATTAAAQTVLDPTTLLLGAGPGLGRSSAELLANPTVREFLASESGTLGGRAAGAATQGAEEAATAANSRPSRNLDYEGLADLRARARSQQTELPGTPAVPVNAADKVIAFTVNNMLSNPASLLANASGGGLETVKRPVVTALSGELGPAGADLRAMGHAIGDALADSATTLATGRRPSNVIEQPEAFGGAAGMVATPFLRIMGATDEFVRTLNSAGAQGAQLARLTRAHPELSQAEIIDRYGKELLDAGTQAAAEATYSSGGTGLGKGLAGVRRQLTAPEATVGQRIGGAAAQVLVPFSVVPDVILKRGFARYPGINELITTPIQTISAVRAGDATAARRAVTSGALATLTNTAILAEVLQGNITGNGPSDPATKRSLMNARDANGNPLWRPNSIKVGDQWMPYSSIGPVAVQLGGIANAIEQYDEAGRKVNPDVAKAWGSALGDTIMDAWYLQTLSGVFSAIKNGTVPEWLGTQGLSTAGRAIPEAGLLNMLRGLTDPVQRQADPKLADPQSWLQYYANRVPGFSETVKPKLDPATGQPIEEPRTPASVLVRGTAPGEPDPVNEELARHNLGVYEAPGTITPAAGLTIAITPDEQRRFLELSGPEVAKRVLALRNNASYQRATADQQHDLLQSVIQDGRDVAAVKIFQGLGKDEQRRRLAAYDEAQKRQTEPSVRLAATAP